MTSKEKQNMRYQRAEERIFRIQKYPENPAVRQLCRLEQQRDQLSKSIDKQFAYMRERGFVEVVRRAVEKKIPLLGICLGMQMMLESSEEAPGVEGLGIFKGTVRLFPRDRGEKVPHMGWNQIEHDGTCPLFAGVPSGSHVYFVHSYYADPVDRSVVQAECDYIFRFAAALGKEKVFAVQFHPEKSQKRGLCILENFVKLCNNGEKS